MSEHMISEFRAELNAIADWWITHTQDDTHGGFIGEIRVDGEKNPHARKGIILNTRILWFFSEAALFTGNGQYCNMADRAYQYLMDYFWDEQHGGVLWELDSHGTCTNDRKQVYAQAFAIYALSAYFRLSQKALVLEQAMALFQLVESKARDPEYGGYLEAFACDWGPMEDMRLSPKDMNSPKSMNTHLHILEAYTALYLASPSERVAAAIRYCLDIFDQRIVNKDNHHLRMFQALDWTDLSDTISYGHDIESSWLIWEAVEALAEQPLIERYRPMVIAMAETILAQGVGENGEVLDAFNFVRNELQQERVWWVQAEALVGFLNAHHLTGYTAFYAAFENVWTFIKRYQKDSEGGEWHWLSTLDAPHRGDCKIGFWKAPYHNGRAMMEVCKLFVKLADV